MRPSSLLWGGKWYLKALVPAVGLEGHSPYAQLYVRASATAASGASADSTMYAIRRATTDSSCRNTSRTSRHAIRLGVLRARCRHR
jgi:hypothetical protein